MPADKSVQQEDAGSSGPAFRRYASGFVSFFSSRWRGEIPLAMLFWRDMIIFGSAINVLMILAAVVLLGLKAPLPVAVAVFFLPAPYNLFLFLSVWRTAERSSPQTAGTVRTAALVWLVAATLL